MRVPRICFVNKMDRVGADFERTISMIAERLTAGAAARRRCLCRFPLGSEESFAGIVDLVRMQTVTHADDLGAEIVYGPIPEGLAGSGGRLPRGSSGGARRAG